MNAMHDPEAIISAWLDEGPTDLPDATRRAIRISLPTTPQTRRGPLAPWRFSPMNTFARVATLAAVSVIAVAGGLYLLGMQPGTGAPTRAPSPSPVTSSRPTTSADVASAPSIPSSTMDTSNWMRFSSGRHGYDARHPAESTVRPAESPLTFQGLELAGRAGEGYLRGSSRFFGTPGQRYDMFSSSESFYPVVGVASTPLPEGMSEDVWLTTYNRAGDFLQLPNVGRCIPPRGDWQAISVDGRSGGFYRGCGFHEVLVFAGGRAYTFTITRGMGGAGDDQDVALLIAFVSTVTLHPDRADDST